MPANDVNVLLDLSANNRVAFDAAVKRMTTVGSNGAGIAYDEALDTVLNHLGPLARERPASRPANSKACFARPRRRSSW